MGPGSRPLPEGIEVCCRSQPRDSGAWAGPVPNPTTHCRHSMRLSEKPAGAVHRNWSSGRGSLSERPSTRCSNSRAVPAPGSAGPEGCPARHASPSCGHEEKSLSTFFLFISFFTTLVAKLQGLGLGLIFKLQHGSALGSLEVHGRAHRARALLLHEVPAA